MKTKHTPPPWDDIDLCDLLNKPVEELEANIKLMNAAPEMLEALEDVIKTIKFWHSGVAWEQYQHSPEMKRINSAIKKARP